MSAPADSSSLWWLRHAESTGNLADVDARRRKAARLELTHRDPDVPLSDTGRQQAEALGSRWRGIEAADRPTMVVSSPYERALQTARLSTDVAGWKIPLGRDERLRERDLGMLDGYTHSGIVDQFPEEDERRTWLGKFYYRPPGGESWADVAARVRSLVSDVERIHAGERLLLVTHQAVILLARYVLEDMTEQEILDVDKNERLANTALTRYDARDGGWRLTAFNDTAHLENTGDDSTADDASAPVTDETDATSITR